MSNYAKNTNSNSSLFINKDVYCVNNKQNYLVTFDQQNNSKKKYHTYKKKLEPLPPNDENYSKKNLFILSIGSNNDFIKRIHMNNVKDNNTSVINEGE